MPTLVLPPRYTEDSIRLYNAAREAGWATERLHGWRAPDWLCSADPILYGEPLFAAVVADALGVALLEPPFDWLTRIPREFLCRDVLFTSISQARSMSRAFIKPADDKCFVARVYDSGAELPSSELLPDSTPVLISEPVKWNLEFRCFVRDRRAATCSPYLRNGELCRCEDGKWSATENEMDQAADYIATVLNDDRVKIPPAVVIDIGIIDGVGWAVLEANPAWGSGIYGCDSAQVLKVIHRASVSRNRVSAEDANWVILRTAIDNVG